MLRWLICWAPIVQRAGSQWQVHWTLIVMLAVLTSQDIMILKHVLKRTMIFCNFGIFAPKSLIRDVADPDAMVGDIQVLAGREGKGEILEALDPSRAVSARGWSSRYCFFFWHNAHYTSHNAHAPHVCTTKNVQFYPSWKISTFLLLQSVRQHSCVTFFHVCIPSHLNDTANYIHWVAGTFIQFCSSELNPVVEPAWRKHGGTVGTPKHLRKGNRTPLLLF